MCDSDFKLDSLISPSRCSYNVKEFWQIIWFWVSDSIYTLVKKLKEHVDIMIFIERYPLKRCQGCVKLIASKVNCFLNINDLSKVQLCMSSNSWTWECPHTKDGADHVPLILLSSVYTSLNFTYCTTSINKGHSRLNWPPQAVRMAQANYTSNQISPKGLHSFSRPSGCATVKHNAEATVFNMLPLFGIADSGFGIDFKNQNWNPKFMHRIPYPWWAIS